MGKQGWRWIWRGLAHVFEKNIKNMSDDHFWAGCWPGSANPWMLAIFLKKSGHKVEGSPGTRFGPEDYSSGGF